MALPGVYTTIKDRFYALSRTNIPIGTKIVVLARRSTRDGTDGVRNLDPYNLQDERAVINAFGDGSEVHRAFLELLSAGAPRVTVVALSKDTTFDYTTGTISYEQDPLDTGTYDPEWTGTDDELWDAAFAAVESADPDIILPYGRGSHPSEWQSPATPSDDPEDFGFIADNSSVSSNSFAVKVANKAAAITSQTHPCIAIMGVKPFVGTSESLTPAEASLHSTLPDLVDREAMPENGIYLVVVQGELRHVGYPAAYGFSNAATAMAGTLSELDSWSSPTGKTMFNIASIRYNASAATKEAVIEKGVSPVGLNIRRQPTWIDSQTFSKTGSDYNRITTTRIVHDAVNLVRQVAQRYVGEASTLETRNSLDTSITAGLKGMQQQGALLASDFVITYDPSGNKAIIDMILTPAFEIRTIDVRVSVQF